VVIFDASHFGADTLLVARAPTLKQNLGWAWIPTETKEYYDQLKQNIEARGWHLVAVVLDGRTGVPRVFEGLPVQICQFHQLQIVRRKLTLRPETEAGQELLTLTFTIAKTNEETFAKALEAWHQTYETFISERTYITGTKHWRYTHRRVRSAYLSLKRNLPFLFTHQKYPELNIPNTTNSLDGYFSRVKKVRSFILPELPGMARAGKLECFIDLPPVDEPSGYPFLLNQRISDVMDPLGGGSEFGIVSSEGHTGMTLSDGNNSSINFTGKYPNASASESSWFSGKVSGGAMLDEFKTQLLTNPFVSDAGYAR